MIQELIFIKYRWLIVFDSTKKGMLRKLGDDKTIPFTIKKNNIMSNPPAGVIPRKLRHFIENTAAKM